MKKTHSHILKTENKEESMKKAIYKLIAASFGVILTLTGCGSASSSAASDSAGASNLQLGAVEGTTLTEEGLIDYSTLSEEELTALYEKEPAHDQTITVNYTGSLCPVALPVPEFSSVLRSATPRRPEAPPDSTLRLHPAKG